MQSLNHKFYSEMGQRWHYPRVELDQIGPSWHYPGVELGQIGPSWHYPRVELGQIGPSWHYPRVELVQIGPSCHYLGKVDTIPLWNWAKLGKVGTIWAKLALSKGG